MFSCLHYNKAGSVDKGKRAVVKVSAPQGSPWWAPLCSGISSSPAEGMEVYCPLLRILLCFWAVSFLRTTEPFKDPLCTASSWHTMLSELISESSGLLTPSFYNLSLSQHFFRWRFQVLPVPRISRAVKVLWTPGVPWSVKNVGWGWWRWGICICVRIC